jgi:ABC-2 type transport system permease protein
MIKIIARKEITELLRDGRFRWTALIVFALLLASLALGWKNYSTVKHEQETAQADSRKSWENQGERNPHSAAHFGVYAYKPKMPLSLIDSGLDNFSGNSIWVEAHYQNPARNRPIEDATALQRFGELTAAGILQLLIPLLIIFLTFDAFAGERNSGTLRQLLSLGVPRSQLVLGKTLGILAALLLLVIPAAVLGVLALALASGNDVLLSSVPRFALMCAGYLLYFIAFIGISLTVSALASSVRASLIVLLAFWIFSCLLIPRFANDTAENLQSIPTNKEFWDAVYKDMKEGIDGHNPSNKRTKELEQRILAQYGVSKTEDLPVNFNGLSLQASEEHSNMLFDKHFGNIWKIHYAQERTQGLFGIASPFLPIRAFSMGMAGTDLRHQEHFSNAVEQYRREFVKMLNLDFAYNSKTKDDYNYFVGKEVWQKSPEFTYESPATNWALSGQVRSLLMLFLWCFGALSLSVWAANRMKAF